MKFGLLKSFVALLIVINITVGYVSYLKYSIQPIIITTMEFQDDSDLHLTSINN